MKKQTKPSTAVTAETPRTTIEFSAPVKEQMEKLFEEIRKIEPVYKQLQSSVELIVSTVLSQAGHDIKSLKDLSLDEGLGSVSFS